MSTGANQPGSGKAVLITGASTGIGQATALHLDALGFTVYAGVRTEQDADRLEAEGSERLFPVFLDVTDPDSTRAAFKDLSQDLSETGLYGLVNNAGIVVGGPLEALPISALRLQFNVNVFGLMAVTQTFLPLIRKSREQGHEPRIVNISSISGRVATPYTGAYAASKFAVEALSDALRLELKPWNIHVSLVEPGAIATPLWEKTESAAAKTFERASEEMKERYGPVMERVRAYAMAAKARGISPDVVAKTIEHALTATSPKVRYLVGDDAKQRDWARLLPDGWVDTMIAKKLGL